MLLTAFPEGLIESAPVDTIRMDPTRTAQGIMTGIGFLGAGVILKEGATIRGLTTAASIWMTASIGILFGVGLWFPALVGLGAALVALAGFRWIEARVPSLVYGRLTVHLAGGGRLSEEELVGILEVHDISCSDLSYRMRRGTFQYEVTIRAQGAASFGRLSETLGDMEHVDEFSIVPTVG
jgi:putative Mg2+ transporter-C (MgtC) family protein